MERDPLIKIIDRLTSAEEWFLDQNAGKRVEPEPSRHHYYDNVGEVRMRSTQPGETFVVGIDFGTESGRAPHYRRPKADLARIREITTAKEQRAKRTRREGIQPYES